MSKPKHTPGPWTGGSECINAPDGKLIAEVVDRSGMTPDAAREIRKANSARIVACVNACEGIETKHLERFLELAKTFIRPCKECDEVGLLAERGMCLRCYTGLFRP